MAAMEFAFEMNSLLKNHFPFILFLLISFLLLIAERIFKIALSQKIKEKLIVESVILISISMVIFGIGWHLSNFYNQFVLKESMRNVVIFFSACYLTRAIHLVTRRNTNIRFLPYISFLFALISSFLFLLPGIKEGYYYLWTIRLKKLFIVLGILSIIWELSFSLKKDTYSKILRFSASMILFLLFLLWEIDYLRFNFKTMIGMALIILLTIFYVLIYSKGICFLRDRLYSELSERDINTIESYSKALISAVYLVIVIKVLSIFSNFEVILNKLDNIYLLNAELIKISFGNILKFIVLSIILFSLLNIGKKLIKLLFPKNIREVEGGSAEALIFNIGILFNCIVLLSTLGITWKVILPIAGTLGVGLGFGLQTIMNNYISGFILLFSKKLKVGDIVELPSVSVSTLGNVSSSVFGKVEDIGILSTIIRTNDGVEIAIPNSSFISSPIVNFSLRDSYVRLKIPVGVSYSSDPQTVRKLLEETIEELPYTVKSMPKQIRFEELGDSALIFRAVFWIDIRKNLWIRNIISDFYFKVWYKLKKAGIEIPFPQNDIWFKNSLKVEIENTNLLQDDR